MNSSDPYLSLGLKRNPFIVEDESRIPEDLWLDRNYPPPPEPDKKQLIQVIGPPGAGKTSLLLHWRERLPGPYRHYPPGFGRLRMPPVASPAYWDEADRIPLLLLNLALRRAQRQAATLICGTHEDLSQPATRFGFTVETIEPPPISPEELIAWSELRIRRVQLKPQQPSPLQPTRELAASIARQAGHSWRIAADLLHVWTARAAARHIAAPDPRDQAVCESPGC